MQRGLTPPAARPTLPSAPRRPASVPPAALPRAPSPAARVRVSAPGSSAAKAVKGLAAKHAPTPPGGTQHPAGGAANPARGGTPPLRAVRAGTPPVGQPPRRPTPPVDPPTRGPAINPGMAQPPRGSTPRASTPPVAAVATKNTRRKDPAASWLAGRTGGGGGRGRGGGRVAGARSGTEAPAAALAGAADSLRRCLVGLLGERPYKRQAIEQACGAPVLSVASSWVVCGVCVPSIVRAPVGALPSCGLLGVRPYRGQAIEGHVPLLVCLSVLAMR